MLFPNRPPFERFLLFVGASAIYAVAWGPLIGQLLVYENFPAWAIAVGALALTFTGLSLHRRAPLAARILSVPYFLVLLGMHLVFGYLSRWMDPFYFWISIALALSVLLPKIGPRLYPWAMALGACCLFGFTGVDLLDFSSWAAVFCFAGLAGVLAGILWLSKRDRLASFTTVAVAFALFSAMIYPRSAVNYTFVFPGQLTSIVAQPGVSAVYDYRDQQTRRDIGTQAMFLARVFGTETFVAGPQNPFHHFVVFTPGTSAPVSRLEQRTRGGDNLLFDPEQPEIVYAATVNELLKISTSPPRILNRITLKQSSRNFNFLRYDPKNDQLILCVDFGRDIFIVDRKSFRLAKTVGFADGARTDDLWPDPTGDQLFVSGTYFLGWRVDTLDRSTLQTRRTFSWPGDLGFHFCTIDVSGRRAFLPSTTSGRVKILDLDTLEPVDEIRMEVGLRNANFDPVRRWLLVSSYFRGNLFVYDVDQKRMLGKLSLGKRLRWVEVDAENGKWYATSASGGFAIDPELAFGIPSSTPDL